MAESLKQFLLQTAVNGNVYVNLKCVTTTYVDNKKKRLDRKNIKTGSLSKCKDVFRSITSALTFSRSKGQDKVLSDGIEICVFVH